MKTAAPAILRKSRGTISQRLDCRCQAALAFGRVASRWGPIGIWFSDHGVLRLAFLRHHRAIQDQAETGVPPPPQCEWQRSTLGAMEAWLSGRSVNLQEIPVDFTGLSHFQVQVLEACRTIPRGSTASYKELATWVGRPRAARAVGNVMRTNPVPLIVPCHRVIRCDGDLGGYSGPGGVALKKQLLEWEQGWPHVARL